MHWTTLHIYAKYYILTDNRLIILIIQFDADADGAEDDDEDGPYQGKFIGTLNSFHHQVRHSNRLRFTHIFNLIRNQEKPNDFWCNKIHHKIVLTLK